MSYTKDESYSVPATLTVHKTDFGGNVTIAPNTTVNNLCGLNGVYGENPNWKADIAAGRQAATVLDATSTKVRPGRVHAVSYQDYKSGANWYTGLGSVVGSYVRNSVFDAIAPTLPTIGQDLANHRALTQLVRKITNAQVAVQGGVLAGEYAETVRLFRGRLKPFYFSLRKYGRAVKRAAAQAKRPPKRGGGGNRRRRRRRPPSRQRALTEAVANTWLEYSFGWAPLISEIDSISQYLEDLYTQKGRNLTQQVIATGYEEIQGIGAETSFTSGAYGCTLRSRYYKTRKCKVKYHASIRVDDWGKWAHRDLGFGMGQFLPTVWELIPYSFLVDYFTNVGDMIEAFSVNYSRVNWKTKTTVYQDKVKHFTNMRKATDSWNRKYRQYFSSTPFVQTTETIFRSPYTGSLIPDLRFEVPGLSMKWLNIAALAEIKLPRK